MATTHTITALQPAAAKRAFTTRCIGDDVIAASHIDAGRVPNAGDLVLCEVLSIGQHKTLHGTSGRRQKLFAGDHIVLAYGDRYAPDQFEARVPDGLEPCHLVAAGGLAGAVCASHDKMAIPTCLQPIGLLVDAGGRTLNTCHYGLDAVATNGHALPPVIAVLGTAMNSGKTTTAVNLIRGLRAAGKRVGAGKITGTGAATDTFGFHDAGARVALDFTDAGYGSTYRLDHADLLRVFRVLVGAIAATGVDVIVLEVADGLYQRETAMLIDAPEFRAGVDTVLFAAQDGAGAVQGATRLQTADLPVAALSGVFTSSALAMREAGAHTTVPVVPTPELETANVAATLLQAPPCDEMAHNMSALAWTSRAAMPEMVAGKA